MVGLAVAVLATVLVVLACLGKVTTVVRRLAVQQAVVVAALPQ